MWNTNMYEVAKQRQADFRREARREQMARMARTNSDRQGNAFSRRIAHTTRHMAAWWAGRPAVEAGAGREQLAC